MSEKISPTTHRRYGVDMVCSVWQFPRSTFYHSDKALRRGLGKRGRAPSIPDNELLNAIKADIKDSHFQGEGHRKVHARLKRCKGLNVGRNRVLKVMREQKLLSPHRSEQSKEKPHDGRITTDDPNVMWGTDAAKVLTLEEGWVWFFGVIEHWNGECLGWHTTKKGNRFAAIEALTRSIEKVFEKPSPEVARGVTMRIDNGSQFLSDGFLKQVKYWGMGVSRGVCT